MPKLRIVTISDTHNASPCSGYTLPPGDILIHAGDLTNNGTPGEIRKALTWLRETDYECKILVGGNHDLALDAEFKEGFDGDGGEGVREVIREDGDVNGGIVYLEHESRVVKAKGVDVKVFGSPYSPASASAEKKWAFQYLSDQAEELWSSIPSDTTILITHTPPAGHLDSSAHWTGGGCPAVTKALSRIRPALHVCGHCHEGRGGRVVSWDDEAEAENGVTVKEWQDPGSGNKKQSLFDLTRPRTGAHALQFGKGTAIVNSSIMAKSYGRGVKTFNKPIVVDIELPSGHTTVVT